MFNIGDIIVYPSQGLGVIDLIEEREFKNQNQNYYIIKTLNNSMKLSLPVDRVEALNIRYISSCDTIDKILNKFASIVTKSENDQTSNVKERAVINAAKLKSGTLQDNLEVIYNLHNASVNSKLNFNEKQILNNTMNFVISEISYVKSISAEEAEYMVNNVMGIK